MYNFASFFTDHNGKFTGNQAAGGQGDQVVVGGPVTLNLTNAVGVSGSQVNTASGRNADQTNDITLNQAISCAFGQGGGAMGGAVWNLGETYTEDRGTFATNRAAGGQGGAVSVTSMLTVNGVNSAQVSASQQNVATSAPYASQSNGITIAQALVFSLAGGGDGAGGAVYNLGEALTESYGKFTNNAAAGGQGGQVAVSGTITLNLANAADVSGSQANAVSGRNPTQNNAIDVNQAISSAIDLLARGGGATAGDIDDLTASFTDLYGKFTGGTATGGLDGQVSGDGLVAFAPTNLASLTAAQVNQAT